MATCRISLSSYWGVRKITDAYFSFAHKEIVIDYTNCDPEKGQQTWYSSFREFLLWPDMEVSEPQGEDGELSDYESLRVARMHGGQHRVPQGARVGMMRCTICRFAM